MQVTWDRNLCDQTIIHLQQEITLRLAKYQTQPASDKYHLYQIMFKKLQTKVTKYLMREFNYSAAQLERKTFKQMIHLLKTEGESEVMTSLLKSNIKSRNAMVSLFWIDRAVSQTLGFHPESLNLKKLDHAITLLETSLCFWEYSIKQKPLKAQR